MPTQFLTRLKLFFAAAFLAGTVALGQAKEVLKAALVKAGDNRAELEAFISTAEKTHSDLGQRAAEFLVEGMPERDLTSLNRQFLTENLDLAMKAREEKQKQDRAADQSQIVSENKVLAHPASVDSIPSSANREDHVSMGSISARKLGQITDNVEHSLGIELLAAMQGIDQRSPLKPSKAVEAARQVIRAKVPTLSDDRPLYRDFETVREVIADGSLYRAVQATVGESLL